MRNDRGHSSGKLAPAHFIYRHTGADGIGNKKTEPRGARTKCAAQGVPVMCVLRGLIIGFPHFSQKSGTPNSAHCVRVFRGSLSI
jgi:hypothetical protein